jgi:hypothetical protein
MAVVFTVVPMIGYLAQGHDSLVFIGLLPAAVGLLMIFGLGRSAWIKSGDSSISYLPAMGSAKVFPRSAVKSIVRVPGSRGLARLVFRDQENRRIISCQESFARSDVEKLAQLLGVKLTWDLSWDNAAQPSNGGTGAALDELKSLLDPEQLAELEKHMKRP